MNLRLFLFFALAPTTLFAQQNAPSPSAPPESYGDCVQGQSGILVKADTTCCPNQMNGYHLESISYHEAGTHTSIGTPNIPFKLCLIGNSISANMAKIFLEPASNRRYTNQSVVVGLTKDEPQRTYAFVMFRPDDTLGHPGVRRPFDVLENVTSLSFFNVTASHATKLVNITSAAQVAYSSPFDVLTIQYCAESCNMLSRKQRKRITRKQRKYDRYRLR